MVIHGHNTEICDRNNLWAQQWWDYQDKHHYPSSLVHIQICMFTMTARKIQPRHVCDFSLAEEDFLDNDAMWTRFGSVNSLGIFITNFQRCRPRLLMEWKWAKRGRAIAGFAGIFK